MGCCFCCMSEDAQIQAVMEKLEIDRVSNATHGHTKFWVGRIMVTNETLIAPVSGKECAYYEVICEEHVQHWDEDPETGRRTERWVWEHRFTEEKTSDFLLADPQGAPAFVPGASYRSKFYSVIDQRQNRDGGVSSRGMKRCSAFDSMLLRHGLGYQTYEPRNSGVTVNGFIPAEIMMPQQEAERRRVNEYNQALDNREFRYHESSFTVNEQVAILGTAQPYNHEGADITILNPPSTDILTEEYFEANDWSGNDKKSWAALTESPSVIGSDDPKYFKGISVENIPHNYSPFAFCAPVYYGDHQPPAMQQQGQPMMQQQGQPMMQQQGQPMMQQQGQPMMQQQGQPMMQQQGQPMMQQQGQPMMQQQGQPMMQQQGQPMMQQQGQPMMQQQGQPMMQQQGQPMMQQQGQPMMQQQGQPMMQQQGQPMMQQQGQPMMQPQQSYSGSTVVPTNGSGVVPTVPTVGVIPTIGPATVVPTIGVGM